MAYCTKAQVGDEVGLEFDGTTKPTATVVDRWIEEADALIDAKIGLRYSVPITNATDLLIIRSISLKIVTARVLLRLQRKTPIGDLDSKSRPADPHAQATKMLNDIVDGKTDLPNSDLLSSTGGMTSFQVQDGDTCPHTFRKDCDQW